MGGDTLRSTARTRTNAQVLSDQAEIDDTDPDVIPNQYGTCSNRNSPGPCNQLFLQYCYFPTEKRPLKALGASPGFASPATRLTHRDYCGGRDAELRKSNADSVGVGAGLVGTDANTIGLLSNSGNEVLHYTFRPSKQIVSN